MNTPTTVLCFACGLPFAETDHHGGMLASGNRGDGLEPSAFVLSCSRSCFSALRDLCRNPENYGKRAACAIGLASRLPNNVSVAADLLAEAIDRLAELAEYAESLRAIGRGFSGSGNYPDTRELVRDLRRAVTA